MLPSWSAQKKTPLRTNLVALLYTAKQDGRVEGSKTQTKKRLPLFGTLRHPGARLTEPEFWDLGQSLLTPADDDKQCYLKRRSRILY